MNTIRTAVITITMDNYETIDRTKCIGRSMIDIVKRIEELAMALGSLRVHFIACTVPRLTSIVECTVVKLTINGYGCGYSAVCGESIRW